MTEQDGRVPQAAPGSHPSGHAASGVDGAPRVDPSRVFVFGSNLAGRHGKGAALFARQHCGAIYGQGEGLQGQSYAIPTKDGSLRTLPLSEICHHVEKFIAFARTHPELRFQLTPIGCGLAGYQHHEIAPMFQNSPATVELPHEFKSALTIINALRDSDRSAEGGETRSGSTEGESAGRRHRPTTIGSLR